MTVQLGHDSGLSCGNRMSEGANRAFRTDFPTSLNIFLLHFSSGEAVGSRQEALDVGLPRASGDG